MNEINELKAEAYDLLKRRGELLLEVAAIDGRLNEIEAQVDAAEAADGLASDARS